jgi:hypothetical protein
VPFPDNILAQPLPSSGADGTEVDVQSIVSNASNLRTGDNPPYTVDNFVSAYPQFGPDGSGNYLVPQPVLQAFITLADASIKEARYHDAWQLCMGLFVAHFAALWLEGTAQAGSPAAQVLEAAKARGLRTSESVGEVSAGYDFSAIVQDLDGWAAWKLTIYGQQLATIARLVGKGGMVVW